MIKTIKKIAGVGKFSNYETKATGLKNDFTRFNVIYGFNTYGKTTICDIMKDINEDAVTRTQLRKTLPTSPTQSVIINCLDPGGAGSVLSLSSDCWNSNTLKDNIFVFDSEFMQRNVFSGLSVIDERETKENFTDFILGSEGVKLASDLEKHKRELNVERDGLKKFIPPSQSGKKDLEIKQYTALKISSTEEDLLAEQIEVQRQINESERRDGLRDEILNCKGIVCLEYTQGKELLDKIEIITEILQREYHISADTITKIERHIHDNMNGYPKAMQWLQVGFTKVVSKNELCPFCGQTTENNQFYQVLSEYFNEDYRLYIAKAHNDLDNVKFDWNFANLSSTILLIKHTFDNIKIYDCKLQNKESLFDDLHDQAVFVEEVLSTLSKAARKELEGMVEKKRATPQTAYAVNWVEFIDAIEIYNEIAKNLAVLVNSINADLLSIQTDINGKPQTGETCNLTQQLEQIKTQRTRLAEDTICESWENKYNEIAGLEYKIKQLSGELDTNQQKYLEEYFSLISDLFKNLGAKDFEISKGAVSNKGYKKVYGITIKYKDVPVTEQSKWIFSESDRRALALAIFIAKVKKLTSEKKNDAIVIFDDPATSFDDNRLKSVISLIFGLSQEVNQVVVFAHHYSFVYNVYLIHKKETTFFKIDPISNVSDLGIFDLIVENEFGTDQYKRLTQIMKFNAGGCNSITINDLRTFMETYLDAVFAKHYYQNGLADKDFGVRIDKYKELSLITDAVALRLHDFRQSFNPESHLYLSTNVEDIRNESCNLINFLFEKVHLTD